MATQIAGSVLSDVKAFVKSSEFVPSSNFYVVCSGGSARLLVKVGTTLYGMGDVYDAQAYPTGITTRAPVVPIGQALPVNIFETGATYVLEALESGTTASVWTV